MPMKVLRNSLELVLPPGLPLPSGYVLFALAHARRVPDVCLNLLVVPHLRPNEHHEPVNLGRVREGLD